MAADFLCGHTTNSAIGLLQRDVLKLVQVAEYAHLAKFRNPGDKDELKIFIIAFQCTEEALEDCLVVLLQFVVFQYLK